MTTATATKFSPIEAKIESGTRFVVITGLDDPATIKVYAAGTVAEYHAACLAVLKAAVKGGDLDDDIAKAARKAISAADTAKAVKLVGLIKREYGNLIIKAVEA